MAHQFLREPLRGSVLREPGGEGLAHGVEVEFVAERVQLFNLRAEQIPFHRAFKVFADFEDGLGLGGLQLADFLGQQGMQGDDGFLLVLGGASTGEEVGTRAFKVQVGSEQLAEFADAQAGVNGGQIDEPPLRRCDSKQPLQFLLSDGTAFGLPSAKIDLGDVFEWIEGKTALAFEPVQESVGEVEIFVKRLRGQFLLMAAPGGEGVGREIVQPGEATFRNELHHSRLHDLLIVGAAAKHLEVGKEIIQMRERGLGEGVAFLWGQGQSGLLALLVLHDGE